MLSLISVLASSVHGKEVIPKHSRKVEVYLKQACLNQLFNSKVRIIFGLFNSPGSSVERIRRVVLESESSELNSASENLSSVSLAFV